MSESGPLFTSDQLMEIGNGLYQVGEAAELAAAVINSVIVGEAMGETIYATVKLAQGALVDAAAGVLTDALVNGTEDLADKAATETTEEAVSVFHGSIKNGSEILQSGLDPTRTPTFATRDFAAAQDALLNHPDAVPGMGTIIESRIPSSQFNLTLPPLERPYSGFYPYSLQSTEITLRTPAHVELFNRYMVK